MLLHEALAARVVNLDKLTYAGNLENLRELNTDSRHRFVRGDICDAALVDSLLAAECPDAIVHFAAESHVDRSILSAQPVFDTNLKGTFVMLEAARTHRTARFVHVSTDEVYGSLAHPVRADESFALQPSSPYSASKAGSDLLALSYFTTYGLPAIVTRSSNNYGPFQFPEKLIPMMIANALADQTLPIYGDGLQIREWLHVDDHCRALVAILRGGREGSVYNIGADEAMTNLEVVGRILSLVGKPRSLLKTVTDRPGHDRRYAISSEKIRAELGWQPSIRFEAGLSETVRWYRDNSGWIERVKTGQYKAYYEQQYGSRLP
jgi:dTDP-glucose 4,6-dehydratase